jgi:hypothetical protein
MIVSVLPKLPIAFSCYRPVTLADRAFEPFPIDDTQTSSGVVELLMTQEFIASILGGRRETVTVAAGRLQDAGLIVRRDAIAQEQEPPAQPFFQSMLAIARGG